MMSVVHDCLRRDAELYSKCLHSTSNHAIKKARPEPEALFFPGSSSTCSGENVKRPFMEAVKSVQTTVNVQMETSDEWSPSGVRTGTGAVQYVYQ